MRRRASRRKKRSQRVAEDEPCETARASLWRNLAKWGAADPAGRVAKPVAAISAFRGRLIDHETGKPVSNSEVRVRLNRRRNEALKRDLVRHDLGFYPVIGSAQEVRQFFGFSYVVPSEEDSFIIQPRAGMAEAEFVAIGRQLLARYDQDFAAVKLPSDPIAFLLFGDGRRMPLGNSAGPRRRGEPFYTVKIDGPRADDSMLERWEIRRERNPFRFLLNWLRSQPQMNRPRAQRGGRRYVIRDR